MRVLGIDPGTVIMGYGVIESEDGDMSLVECGVLTAPGRAPMSERLNSMFEELLDIIRRFRPEVMAVEQPFVAKNARTALAIGRAQAVALLAAANRGLPAHEYTPAQIKQRVAGYGGAGKEQIQEMVRLQLGLAEAPCPADAADALAVAICHLNEAHLTDLLARGS